MPQCFFVLHFPLQHTSQFLPGLCVGLLSLPFSLLLCRAGLITTTGPLDREAGSPFIFRVYAVDIVPPGQPTHTGTATVLVDVIDVNDNKPTFTQPTYTYTVPETIPVGANVGTVSNSCYFLCAFSWLHIGNLHKKWGAFDPSSGRGCNLRSGSFFIYHF